MVFWRKEDKSKPAGDPQALVDRREYDAAIKAYRDLIAAKPGQYMLHHKVADVFCLAGRQSEAMADYGKAAEGYARDGYLIKAAAILKKMQKIEPANAGVARKLADLGQLGPPADHPRREVRHRVVPPRAQALGQVEGGREPLGRRRGDGDGASRRQVLGDRGLDRRRRDHLAPCLREQPAQDTRSARPASRTASFRLVAFVAHPATHLVIRTAS